MGLACQFVAAQDILISGTVEDEDGPVMMGNVVERDANNRIVSATQTDFNGNFSMQVKSKKNKLVFSYVGDKTQTLTIGDKTTFKVILESENTTLTEVVVKGRSGSSGGLLIPKREMTTSQQVMNMTEVEGLAFTSVDEALQGEIAGLDVVSNSGNLVVSQRSVPMPTRSLSLMTKSSTTPMRISITPTPTRSNIRHSSLSTWRISQASPCSRMLLPRQSGAPEVLMVSS